MCFMICINKYFMINGMYFFPSMAINSHLYLENHLAWVQWGTHFISWHIQCSFRWICCVRKKSNMWTKQNWSLPTYFMFPSKDSHSWMMHSSINDGRIWFTILCHTFCCMPFYSATDKIEKWLQWSGERKIMCVFQNGMCSHCKLVSHFLPSHSQEEKAWCLL